MTAETLRLTRRSLALLALAAFMAIGVALLVGKAAGYANLLDSLRAANLALLAVCLLGEILAYFGYVLAFRGTASVGGGPKLDARTSAGIVFASLGATRLLAAGGAGGLALDYWALRRAGASRHESVVRVLGLNTLLYAVFGAAAWAAALALVLGGKEVSLAMTLPWLLAIPACFIAAGALSTPRRAGRLARTDHGRLWIVLSDAVQGVILARTLIAQPRRHVATLAGAGLYWGGDILCLWAGLRAFRADVALAAVVLAYATGYVATLLPLPTGGVGGVDAAMTFALVAVGVPLAAALLGVFAYRLFSFWLPTLPGLAALPALPRLSRRLDEFRRGRPPLPPAVVR
jgi:putative heme transporter